MNDTLNGDKLFSLFPQRNHKVNKPMMSAFFGVTDRLLGIDKCRRIYSQLTSHQDPCQFIRGLLDCMNVRWEAVDLDRRQFPKEGPVVVVANHPFGGIEGLLLAELLLSIRRDVRVVANYLLQRILQLNDLFIPVDPFNRSRSIRNNVGPLRKAVTWVKNGGVLLVFPAGEVSHITLAGPEIADPQWHPMVAKIVHKASATVVPIFVKGHNGLGFHTAGMLHPRLRTALLVREFLNKCNTTVPVRVGAPIQYRWLKHYADDRRLVDYLRWRTYLLGYGSQKHGKGQVESFVPKTAPTAPLVTPRAVVRIKKELAGLDASQRLERSGAFTVWQATADQIPETMIEIARLRELSFRAAGEGTGQPLDMDRFDHIYRHIFIWNEDKEEIVGAYRLGSTDYILEKYGKSGLYTHTLFRSRTGFYNKLGPALEMGRSFVRPEYQKSYASLLLLWKGIGRFVAGHPRYRILFGPVSISRDYSDLTRRLIATTLLRHHQAKDLAVMVTPRQPAPLQSLKVPGCKRIFSDPPVRDFKEVCALIGDLEFQSKEAPVLLRHYLNLGGQLLAFSLDRHFSDVMDGLIVVDLLKSDRKLLRRYMGADGVAMLYNYHSRRIIPSLAS